MERLNRLLLTLGQHQMTTLSYAVLDLERERMTLVSAGHLPPIMRGPAGETAVLAVAGNPPLGVSAARNEAAVAWVKKAADSSPACSMKPMKRGRRMSDL